MTKADITPAHTARQEQIREFLDRYLYHDAELYPLAGDASYRRYIRVRKEGRTAMLMDAPPEKENVSSYLAIAEHLYRQGYSAPQVLAGDAPAGLLLLEDLGDDSYTSVLKSAAGVRTADERELYEAAVDVLAEWHGASGFADPKSLKLPTYNEALLMQEAGLFADWYLPQVLGKDEAGVLRPEYTALWQGILTAAPLSTGLWVHRDYHADNLMWLPSRVGARRVGLLDFQDGVYGDAAYDMVSLLEDARRDVSGILAEAMLARYIAARGADRERFMAAYAVLGAQRNCKIIGIFTRLAARDKKFAYLHYLPRVWRHLETDLAHPSLAALKQWLDRHIPADRRGIITLRHNSCELALTA